MRIDRTNRSAGHSPSKSRAGSTGKSGFTPVTGVETARASATSGVAALGSLDAILALQSVEDSLSGRRRAVQRGHDILDVLENIKMDLLAGNLSGERLTRLAAMLSKRQAFDDPDLAAVVDEIELRAKVELAKLGRFVD